MWAVMCVCHQVCHMQAWSCLSTGWALNRCFAWFFGTVAVLAQKGGGVLSFHGNPSPPTPPHLLSLYGNSSSPTPHLNFREPCGLVG